MADEIEEARLSRWKASRYTPRNLFRDYLAEYGETLEDITSFGGGAEHLDTEYFDAGTITAFTKKHCHSIEFYNDCGHGSCKHIKKTSVRKVYLDG